MPRFRLSKETLERAYQKFHQEFYRDHDPVGLVHRYTRPEDQEVVGLITALFSYGNVRSIRQSVEKILLEIGERPADFLASIKWPDRLDGFYHRFNRGSDLRVLFYWIGKTLQTHGSLQQAFLSTNNTALPMRDRLSAFVKLLAGTPLPEDLRAVRAQRARNLKYLFSDPEDGAACKRLNMYLRWMARPADGIDLGAWSQVGYRDLILPVDTHVLKTLQKLSWTRSKTANWKVAEVATERLRAYCPDDPIRYDFSLCHLSMHGQDIAAF